ncbi:hypothetical protein BDV12DRAFT_187888 [Aspergillus spectabilis]
MSDHVHSASGTPDNVYFPKVYWAAVGSIIGAATLANIVNHILAYQRLNDQTPTPSKPKSLFFQTLATLTALLRETSNATPPPVLIRNHKFYLAPLGPSLLILINLTLTLSLCFYRLNTSDQWSWESVGYRAGLVTIAQLPLIFLLSGRTNLITFLTGANYTQLLWYHRWIARTLWLTATLHMGFFFRSWGRYHYILHQLRNEYFAKRGFAAWCILTAIVLLSAKPVRGMSYEVFVLGHLVLFAGFLGAIWVHVPGDMKVWVWIPVGLVGGERVVRYAWGAYINVGIFHRRGSGSASGVAASPAPWRHRASFTPLPGNITRVTIANPGIRWKAGQYMYLTCHSIAPLQSHPFTISSIPEDGKLEFLIRAQKGGTRRLFDYASSKRHDTHADISRTGPGIGDAAAVGKPKPRTVFLEGPYGTHRTLSQFDSIILIAGGMGVTFTMPLFRDSVAKWKETGSRQAVTRRIRIVWVIKSRGLVGWFERELRTVLSDINQCRREAPDVARGVEIGVYLTREEEMEEEPLPMSVSISDGHQLLPSSFEQETRVELVSNDSNEMRAPTTNREEILSATSIELEPYPSSNRVHHCTTTINEERGQVQPETPPLHPPKIPLISGRPSIRPIIREVLGKAQGESAVVVCGPESLAEDVRRSVVYLSDERAVHKGTGAQGVYLHVENFGW